MENTPLIPEREDDNSLSQEKSAEDKKPTKDKKKSRLGLYVVKNESQEKPKFEDKSEKDVPKKPELATVPEPEVPLEKPSDTEAAELVRPKLVEVIEANESEQPPDPITDPPVEQFRELVKSGEDPEEAFSQVISELDVDESEIEAIESSAEEPDIEVEAEADEEQEPESETDEQNDFEEISLESETEPEPEAESPTTAASSAASTQPAQPPRPAYIPPTPPAFRPPFGPPPPGGQNPNIPPIAPAPSPNVLPQVPEYHQASPAAMALFGGIIGYLIGRRRGRIKTEKKLLPIQKKLEKEVEDMQFDLQQKEKKIRRLAAAKANKEADVSSEGRRKAPEAVALHAPQPKPERIGHMLVNAESKAKDTSSAETQKHTASDSTTSTESIARTDRRIETLNRTELLAVSEKIIIDGSSLRQIYETHLIGERGLRRLVAEQMRGGDLKKALQMEIVEREIDFERDPATRDITPQQNLSQSAASSHSNETLNQLVEKASANIGDNGEQAAFIRARANYEAEQTKKQRRQRRVIDASFITVLVILVTAIILLIITRA